LNYIGLRREGRFIMILPLWTTMYIQFANCGYLGVEAVVLLASAFRLQRGVVVGYDVTLGTGTPAENRKYCTNYRTRDQS
jgi:hypothetical protein